MNNIVNIDEKLKTDILDYCSVNNISDIESFISKILNQGFLIEKYGTSPIKPQYVEKEVIKEVEKLVEVPVEKIVEVVKEVPVEKIVEVVKEVPVEKIVEREVFITNNEEIHNVTNELSKKTIENEDLNKSIEKLKEEISTKEVTITETLNKLRLLENELSSTSKERLLELYEKINNLEDLLEIERNRNSSKLKIDNPFNEKHKSSINWVPKEKRENNDLYNE
jgi:hypothetical protein